MPSTWKKKITNSRPRISAVTILMYQHWCNKINTSFIALLCKTCSIQAIQHKLQSTPLIVVEQENSKTKKKNEEENYISMT